MPGIVSLEICPKYCGDDTDDDDKECKDALDDEPAVENKEWENTGKFLPPDPVQEHDVDSHGHYQGDGDG